MGDPDAHAIRTWHYPLNEPKRQYQYDVVQDCLLANTLIVLPNGLGTMFIVSVVAHNFLRWFPEGKAVFLASTRTLLRQQMQSARAITEIRAESMAELTSSQNSEQRLRLWSSKSLLLSTPQLLRNDLISGICHYDNIVLLILDEARRAAENRLYYEIVQFLKENGRLEHVRIIALSSTSSSTISAVQRLVSSLFISRVFLRTVKSPDVAPYVHFKEIERIIVPESSSIKFLRSQFEKHFLQPPIARLKDLGYLEGMELDTLSHSKLLDLGRGRHNSERGKSTKLGVAKETLGSLTLLYYAYELLISYGMIPFRAFFKKSLTEASFPAQTRLHDELSSVPAFHQLMAYVDKLLESSLFSGHPKIDIAEERLRELAIGKSGAMMIVVSRCRDSALELASRLARNSPLLRAMSFAPQPSRVNPNSQKISQKQQTEV